ncbi:MAG TPA: acyltransferase [Acidobacteriaceae bacterium]|jgi:galactoside O-acetyltransferase
MAILNRTRLAKMRFASLGSRVSISDKASFYNCGNISLGDDVRIDDFCVISAGPGGIFLGNHIHIAVSSSLIGAGAITLGDFVNLSSRVAIYSSSDDFSGEWMTNPMIPSHLTGVIHSDVTLGRHVVVGSGSVILPGVVLGDGVAVGALTLIKRNCDPFGVYGGVPARKIGERKRRFLELEKQLGNTTG